MDLAVRFWSKVSKGAGCWIWQAYKFRYGTFRIGNKMVLAHRVAFDLAIGPIPPSLDVLHSCDNGHCVNPDHLFLGTHSDNMQDRQRKGRWVSPVLLGYPNPAAKVTREQAKEIRTRYEMGTVKQHELAAEYGVTQSNISMIVHNRTWA